VTLRDCPAGTEVVLVHVTADGPHRRRLLEWGFVPGARLRLVTRACGGLVIALGDARVALSANLAGTLIVEGYPGAAGALL
jgi:Fe2+ transport system protein FeoA